MCTSDIFRPYHWLYPGLYQPLHASAVLLSDLLRNPHSTEAQQSITVIDKIFSLISPHDGVVSEDNGVFTERHLSEGGREAWAMLRRLRRKAWENVGRDPNVLWTEVLQESSPAAGVDVMASQVACHDRNPLAEELEAPIDFPAAHSELLFPPEEEGAYILGYGSSQFNWLEWDAAVTGKFDTRGIY